MDHCEMGKRTLPGLISAYYSTKESLLRGVLHPKGRHKCLCFPLFLFPPCFPRLWIWAVVPLKNPSFSLVFIDARRDGLVVHPGQRERGREGRKTHKRKGMKVAVNMRFNGWAIPSKLAASRQEFDAALVDCQTLIYEEMKRETRELEVARTQMDEERWREEKKRIKSRTCHIYIALYLVFISSSINTYSHPLFHTSFLCDFRSLPSPLLPPSLSSLHSFCVQQVILVCP